MEPRGREQVIAAGDPRPPELRRPSPRSWAQRQPPGPGLIEASCRLRTRFPGIPLLARVSEAPGSREASGAAAARGKQSCGRAGTTGPRAVTTSRARALGAVFALQPRGSRCKLLQRLKLRVRAGWGLRAPLRTLLGRRGRHVTAPAREGAGGLGFRGLGRRQAAAHGGPGLQPSNPPRPGPAEAAALPPSRGRTRSKLPELRAGPRAAASGCAVLPGDTSPCALAPHP